jgi:glycosyltransferase involved in cell wall biosynthesis
MDLLFLTQTYPRTPEDTAGPFIRELARALVRGGDRVRVLAPHAPGLAATRSDDGVEVATFRYAPGPLEVLGYSRSLARDEAVRGASLLVAPLYALAARRAVGRALQVRWPEVVQAHWVVPNAPLVRFAARRVPVGGGIHGSDVFLAERRGVRGVVRRALARCSFLTGCSPELVARVCALGFPAERARVIPYGVDAETFHPDATRRSIWRQRLGIPLDAPLLLGLGRMATKKGFQVLVQELPALLAAAPTAHVVLAGAGDLLAGFQQAMAGEPRVHFPGAVLRDTLPDLFRAADAFVLPAIHDGRGNVDGLPNVVLEAMASALPVVATPVSGIPLAVRDGVEGVLVPEGDGGALREALLALLADPQRGRALGEAARRRAAAELGWDRVAALYREAYREGIAHARAAARVGDAARELAGERSPSARAEEARRGDDA